MSILNIDSLTNAIGHFFYDMGVCSVEIKSNLDSPERDVFCIFSKKVSGHSRDERR